jgi:hypothetical protein
MLRRCCTTPCLIPTFFFRAFDSNNLKFEGKDFLPSCLALMAQFAVSIDDLVLKLESKMFELSKGNQWEKQPTSSGSFYFRNIVTGETRWDAPGSRVSAKATAAAASAAEAVQLFDCLNYESDDYKGNQAFTVSTQHIEAVRQQLENERKQEEQRNFQRLQLQRPGQSTEAVNHTGSPRPLPAFWEKQPTSSGSFYFRNIVTGETRWDAPGRQRAGGSAADLVAVEPAKEGLVKEVDEDEFERRQRNARREGFVEDDTGELFGRIFIALFLIAKAFLTYEFRNRRLWQQ